ncbi:MAG: uridine kinase [Maricaulis sp.]|nr:uridine kinase [Maricaulis sp.]
MTPKVTLLGIVGGSASGKTCLAEEIARQHAHSGTYVLSEDDYYVDAGNLPGFDPHRFNFDEPAAKDHSLLLAHLEALKAGQPVEAPLYDFTTHCRREETQVLTPAPLVVIEGLHLLASTAISQVLDLSVFVDADRDVRFQRRLARDVATRGRQPDFVKHQFETIVDPMHVAHVEPQKVQADLIIENMGAPDFAQLAEPVLARLTEQ